MNKQRRKNINALWEKLEELRADIEIILDEEQEAYDNMPEAFQDGERGETAKEAIDNLESAINDIESALYYLDEAAV